MPSSAAAAHFHIPSFVVLLLLCFSSVVQCHWCGHDSAMHHSSGKHRAISRGYARRGEAATAQQPQQWAPLRVNFYTDYIMNDVDQRTCYAEGQVYRRGTASNDTAFCTPNKTTDCLSTCSSDLVVTWSARDDFLSSILRWVQDELGKMLSVKQEPSALALAGLPDQSRCGAEGGVIIPHQHIDPGIPDADLILYVTVRPVADGILAWAVPCVDEQGGRAIAGQINLSPSLLNDKQYGTEFIRGVVLHEITHVLGFSNSRFSQFQNGRDNVVNQFLRTFTTEEGTTVNQVFSRVISPKLLEKARNHFGCPSLQGVPLEDFGGDGTAGSHWEKIAVQNELMIGSASFYNPGGTFIVSDLTLAVLEDSGWYKPNYSYSQDKLIWGKNAGCRMFDYRCEDWNLEDEGLFCNDERRNYCTFNHKAKGYCKLVQYSQNLGFNEHFKSQPLIGGFDAYANYCPFVYAYTNAWCTDDSVDSKVRRAGEFYGTSSGCFEANLVEGSADASKAGIDVRCLEYRCLTDHMEIRVGDKWLVCPQDGSRLVHTNDALGSGSYSGFVTCPKNGFRKLCSSTAPMQRVTNGTGPATGVEVLFPDSQSNCWYIFCVVSEGGFAAQNILANISALILVALASLLFWNGIQ